ALIGGSPGFDIFRFTIPATGMAARPTASAPPVCAQPSSLSLDMPATSAPPRGTLALTATGGSGGGFRWSFASNASGGSIDATSGAYTAGQKGGVTDIVKATDSLGNIATASVSVSGGGGGSGGGCATAGSEGFAALVLGLVALRRRRIARG